MNVLALDIASGGVSAALFDENLSANRPMESPWQILQNADGSAVLDVSTFEQALTRVVRAFAGSSIQAISLSCFMHSCLLLDHHDVPLTPVFTWMDRRGEDGVEYIRQRFGTSFHERTGCRYHPMYPVFKLASFHQRRDPALQNARRIVTAKSLAVASLTGQWIEDHGTATASGLCDVRLGQWDKELLHLLELKPNMLPPIVGRTATAGAVTTEAERRFGIPAGIPVIAGSGDGFLANVGSGCESAERLAITLGTSASVRSLLPIAVLDDQAGTFCYRADSEAFLLGCASNNGGNVLDWARATFGPLPESAPDRADLPTFIPLLHGERSPDWNPKLEASWHGISFRHTTEDLAQAVTDGVVFNLAHYVDILRETSGQAFSQVVLSGNGFLNRSAAERLAAVLSAQVLLPKNQGLASLRGAAAIGFRGMSVDPSSAVEDIVSNSEVISAAFPAETRRRYERYRELRRRS